jgi:two-component system response regulator AtoC
MTLVLVVDDVAPLAEQYAYDLRRTGGYEVLTASGGEKALAILSEAPVDCVVLDLEMPGMDGFDVLRALERKGSQAPVIVYTGTGSYDRCVQALRLGAYGFIDKAEPMERVVHEIESAMERRRLRSEVGALPRPDRWSLGRPWRAAGRCAR